VIISATSPPSGKEQSCAALASVALVANRSNPVDTEPRRVKPEVQLAIGGVE
jgi:hypothetical protein